MNDSNPLREATSFLMIVAFFVGIGCYFAQVNHVPVMEEVLVGLASLLFDWIPALHELRFPQAPTIVSSFAGALLVFAAGVPFTPAIARMFRPRIGVLEDQMRGIQKKRHRGPVRID